MTGWSGKWLMDGWVVNGRWWISRWLVGGDERW